jgi:hypothetical protein
MMICEKFPRNANFLSGHIVLGPYPLELAMEERDRIYWIMKCAHSACCTRKMMCAKGRAWIEKPPAKNLNIMKDKSSCSTTL